MQALDITVSLVGSAHPDVATAMSYIGVVHEKKGDKDEAARFYQQVISVCLYVCIYVCMYVCIYIYTYICIYIYTYSFMFFVCICA